MRIPVSFSDHDNVFPRQIELLRQRFFPTLGDDAPYADFFAKIMGYVDYNELLEARVENVLQPPSVTRYAFQEGMIWNAFSQGCCSYLDACSLMGLLDYELFDCTLSMDLSNPLLSSLTSTSGSASDEKRNHTKRRKFSPFCGGSPLPILNSIGMDQVGMRKTARELVEAGAPVSEVIIYQDGRGFCWSRVLSVVRLLPNNLDDRLSRSCGYLDISDSHARRMKFWKEEIVGPLHESGWMVARRNRIIPDGFETILKDGVAYLYNKVLKGYIPYSFEPESKHFFEAIVQIISGKVVSFDEIDLDPVDDRGFRMVSQGRLQQHEENVDGNLTPLGRTVKSIPVNAGEIFYEDWQPYLRAQNWIKPSELPSQVVPKSSIKTIHHNRLSPLVVPTWHAEFTSEIRNELNANVAAALREVELLLPGGEPDRIVDILAAYCAVDIDRRISYRINKGRKLRDKVLPGDLTAEEFKAECEKNGSNIRCIFPGLAGFSDFSLGWVHYIVSRVNKSQEASKSFSSNLRPQILAVVALLLSSNESVIDSDLTFNDLEAALFGLMNLINGLAKSRNGYNLTDLEGRSVSDMSTLPGYKEALNLINAVRIQESFITDVGRWRLDEARRSALRMISGHSFTKGEVNLEDVQPVVAYQLGGVGKISGNRTVSYVERRAKALQQFSGGVKRDNSSQP